MPIQSGVISSGCQNCGAPHELPRRFRVRLSVTRIPRTPRSRLVNENPIDLLCITDKGRSPRSRSTGCPCVFEIGETSVSLYGLVHHRPLIDFSRECRSAEIEKVKFRTGSFDGIQLFARTI